MGESAQCQLPRVQRYAGFGQLAWATRYASRLRDKPRHVTRLVTADGDLPVAEAGDAVTLVLDREVDASRGDVIALADQPLEMTDQFEATLVWMHDDPGLMGRAYELKLANQWASASITDAEVPGGCEHPGARVVPPAGTERHCGGQLSVKQTAGVRAVYRIRRRWAVLFWWTNSPMPPSRQA